MYVAGVSYGIICMVQSMFQSNVVVPTLVTGDGDAFAVTYLWSSKGGGKKFVTELWDSRRVELIHREEEVPWEKKQSS